MTRVLGGDKDLDAAGITTPALRAGYAKCRTLNSEHGKTYYLATLLLPPEKRPYVHALYGFARHADDMVDGGDRRAADRFAHWAEDTMAELDWGASSDPIIRAVIDTRARWDIPLSYFSDFLDAMRSDLTTTEYDTYEALAQYMWGSSAVIGLEMLPILGRADESVEWHVLEPYAIDLGMAFQLTNFIRDVGEDLKRGRVYLPKDALYEFGVDRDRLALVAATGEMDEPVRNLLAFHIEKARELYRRAAPGVDLVHPTSQDCLRTAATLYSEILVEIEANDYDVFSDRVSVGLARRAQVAVPAMRAARRARRPQDGRPLRRRLAERAPGRWHSA